MTGYLWCYFIGCRDVEHLPLHPVSVNVPPFMFLAGRTVSAEESFFFTVNKAIIPSRFCWHSLVVAFVEFVQGVLPPLSITCVCHDHASCCDKPGRALSDYREQIVVLRSPPQERYGVRVILPSFSRIACILDTYTNRAGEYFSEAFPIGATYNSYLPPKEKAAEGDYLAAFL